MTIANDSRCRIISRPNTGIVGALNDGFAVCSGTDYIARMDADDVAEPERFLRQVEYLDTHPECVAVGCQVLAIDPDGDPVCLLNTPLEHDAIEALLFQGQGGAISHPAVMIRRKAFEQVKGYDPQCSVAEDIDLYLKLGEIGRLANLPDMLLRYRLHLGSLNVMQRHESMRFVNGIIKNARKRRGLVDTLPDLSNYNCTMLEVRAMWGYKAVAGGNYRTAFKHAVRCVFQRPWKFAWWRLVAASIKGLARNFVWSGGSSHTQSEGP